jgi:exopolyphosphatase/guanosine-5'-triphosphate,3'-diphosphate pyrophosphatase
MTEEMHRLLLPFEERQNLAASVQAGQVQMLGTSGTVTTLCGVHLELPRYDRSRVDGGYLDFLTIERLSQRLAAMSLDERAAIPSIGRERADLVVAGCAILAAICRLWPVGRLRIADRGVREGILFGLLAEGLARRKTDKRWPNRFQAGL